jgi:hypothetical protein
MGNIIEVQHPVKRRDGFTAVARGRILRPAGPQRGGRTTTTRTLWGRQASPIVCIACLPVFALVFLVLAMRSMRKRLIN